VRYKINFDFVKHRNKLMAVYAIILLLGIVSLLVRGLNYGVDFQAGTNMDIDIGANVTAEQAKDILAGAGYPDVNPTVGGGGDRLTVRFPVTLTQQETSAVEEAFAAKFGEGVSSEVNTVDPELAREQLRNAVIGVLIASIGVVLYVIVRFEWRFAFAGIVTLFLDAFVVISVFSLFQFEVSLTFIAAVLTIIGYSINDTIVIFDRIRENLRFAKLRNEEDLSEIVNNSIWQTFTRSINTGVTVLFAAVALYVFGSESIRLFSLAIIIGTVAGAYSSIGVASQLWYVLKKGSLGRSK